MSKVRLLFEQRCVACHSCYESPCQLKLSSYEGFMRGAHGSDIYADRFKEKLSKHRMFKDAKTIEGWREKGFWKITEQDHENLGMSDDEKLNRSLLWRFVELGSENNIAGSSFEIHKKRDAKSCKVMCKEHRRL